MIGRQPGTPDCRLRSGRTTGSRNAADAADAAWRHGARVVGLCGGADKAAWLRDACGIAEIIDHKAEDVRARLDALCPDGIDVFFDNVGGALLRDVMARTRRHGRIVLCGQISTYDAGAADPSPDMMRIIYGGIRLEGFLAFDFVDRFPEARAQLERWVADGTLSHREDVRDGFDRLPENFASLFSGGDAGTLVARLCDPDGNPL